MATRPRTSRAGIQAERRDSQECRREFWDGARHRRQNKINAERIRQQNELLQAQSVSQKPTATDQDVWLSVAQALMAMKTNAPETPNSHELTGVALPVPQPGRFQMVTTSNGIVKMDTATGQAWTLKEGAWITLEEVKTGEERIEAESEVMNQWEEEITKKDPNYPKIQAELIAFATPQIKKRSSELGRPLTPIELREEADSAYRKFVRDRGAAQQTENPYLEKLDGK